MSNPSIVLSLTIFIIIRPNGVRFTAPAGTTEFSKRWHPQPGDVVSFKHRGFLLTSQKPKLPTVYRIRTDITWEDVVRNHKTPSLLHWGNIESRKKFFLGFAEQKGFDPYVSANWEDVRHDEQLKKVTNLDLQWVTSRNPKLLSNRI